ncbi:hypothetical protein FACS1894139_10020 [Planctomycetales bacterium]|nr:hypothetical protein FACS1894107_01680 [Planctomycetales bacterium]GHS97236.1 hypothetical protein FACS1894108_03270 [Planctomycetales bacterium]GHT05706.1 hypothetical protein FACS1894139_10020 [Planctomycetales bacterium]GHV21104.1 hypothetical protein AGMMS49959_09660 [Planctomycetales bacterium]
MLIIPNPDFIDPYYRDMQKLAAAMKAANDAYLRKPKAERREIARRNLMAMGIVDKYGNLTVNYGGTGSTVKKIKKISHKSKNRAGKLIGNRLNLRRKNVRVAS